MSTIPLAVLDLIPRSSGDSVATAVGNAVDLARQAERLGYQRYWFAEHHLNPGVLSASPAVSIALVAGATGTIRIGSAGVQLGHRQPLATVEEAAPTSWPSPPSPTTTPTGSAPTRCWRGSGPGAVTPERTAP